MTATDFLGMTLEEFSTQFVLRSTQVAHISRNIKPEEPPDPIEALAAAADALLEAADQLARLHEQLAEQGDTVNAAAAGAHAEAAYMAYRAASAAYASCKP